MNESINEINQKRPFYIRHLFGTMIFSAVLVSFILVLISMNLYYNSGSAQLDLSSPNYQDVRNQIDTQNNYKDYSITGEIDDESMTEYKALFTEKASKIKTIVVFGGDPLSDESLGILE